MFNQSVKTVLFNKKLQLCQRIRLKNAQIKVTTPLRSTLLIGFKIIFVRY